MENLQQYIDTALVGQYGEYLRIAIGASVVSLLLGALRKQFNQGTPVRKLLNLLPIKYVATVAMPIVVAIVWLEATGDFAQKRIERDAQPTPETSQTVPSTHEPEPPVKASGAAGELVLVERVVDGDTVVLADGRRVRLHGIDAPERNQPYGREATSALSGFLVGDVRLVVVDTDRYGRTVGKLIAGSPRKDVQLQMVCGGYAWWYERYAKRDYSLEACQQSAQVGEKGLWSLDGAVAPWDWRKR